MKKLDLGKLVIRWRVIKNENYLKEGCNEMKYTLQSVLFNPQTGLMREQGSRTWKHQQCDLFTTRQGAEKWLCELNYNEHCNRAIFLQRELDEIKEELNQWKLDGNMTILELQNKIKTNTKQVCDKIRDKLKKSNLKIVGKDGYEYTDNFLDQFEKGEA